jgi:hypothetical protein
MFSHARGAAWSALEGYGRDMKAGRERRHERARAEYAVRFTREEWASRDLASHGLTVDVSQAGMAFHCSERLDAGAFLRVTCAMLWGEESRPARVVYCNKTEGTNYRVGVALEVREGERRAPGPRKEEKRASHLDKFFTCAKGNTVECPNSDNSFMRLARNLPEGNHSVSMVDFIKDAALLCLSCPSYAPVTEAG